MRIRAVAQTKDRGRMQDILIGLAEKGTDYWQADWRPGHPEWLRHELPDRPEFCLVCYWMPGWWALCFDRIEKLAARGCTEILLRLDEGPLYLGDDDDVPNL